MCGIVFRWKKHIQNRRLPSAATADVQYLPCISEWPSSLRGREADPAAPQLSTHRLLHLLVSQPPLSSRAGFFHRSLPPFHCHVRPFNALSSSLVLWWRSALPSFWWLKCFVSFWTIIITKYANSIIYEWGRCTIRPAETVRLVRTLRNRIKRGVNVFASVFFSFHLTDCICFQRAFLGDPNRSDCVCHRGSS